MSWHNKKQNSVALSMAEAEYIATGLGCAQVLWMKQILSDFGLTYSHVAMKFAGIQVNTIKRWTRMLPHVAHKIFDSEQFGRMLAQSSVCASSGIHTNVSSLLLILPAQIGSSSFFIFRFLSLPFLKPWETSFAYWCSKRKC